MAFTVKAYPAASLQDTYLDTPSTTTSYHTSSSISVGNFPFGVPYTRRGLIKFDIEAAGIPPGSDIVSASINLKIVSSAETNYRIMSAYRVLRKWWDTTTSWNHYDEADDLDWGTAGCGHTTTDREASASGSIQMTAGMSINDWIAVEMDTNSISQIIDGAFTDNGFLLQMDTESNDRFGFYTYDKGGSDIPYLEISYNPPGQRRAAKYMVDFWGDEMVLIDRKGHKVQPWEVETDEWGMCTGLDYPSAKRPDNYYADSGMFYIEGIDYRPPALSITTDINDFADQLMRRLAGG